MLETLSILYFLSFFFFNDTATTEIYTLSLHDALPISSRVKMRGERSMPGQPRSWCQTTEAGNWIRDRKSTRLNSSHSQISYAVFCLKKKKFKITRNKLTSYHDDARLDFDTTR